MNYSLRLKVEKSPIVVTEYYDAAINTWVLKRSESLHREITIVSSCLGIVVIFCCMATTLSSLKQLSRCEVNISKCSISFQFRLYFHLQTPSQFIHNEHLETKCFNWDNALK